MGIIESDVTQTSYSRVCPYGCFYFHIHNESNLVVETQVFLLVLYDSELECGTLLFLG